MSDDLPKSPLELCPPVGSLDLLPTQVKPETFGCKCAEPHKGTYNPECPLHGEAREKEIAEMTARARVTENK
jgi:hypothetical protein